MKSLLQFLSESAAQQATRLGLKGDGHGGWYDRTTGEFVAKTEKGRLKFYNKRQKLVRVILIKLIWKRIFLILTLMILL